MHQFYLLDIKCSWIRERIHNKAALVSKLDDNIKKNPSPLYSLQKYHPPPPNMVMNTVVAEMSLKEQTDAPVELDDNDLEIEKEDG